MQTLAWILGAVAALNMVSIILRARLSALGKAILLAVEIAAIAVFVVPQTNPLAVLASFVLLAVGVRALRTKLSFVPVPMAAVLASVAAVAVLGTYCSPETVEYSGNVVEDVRKNVAGRWERIVEECDRVVDVYRKRTAPGSKPTAPGRAERKRLARIRELLLPVDCRQILSAVDDLDKRIAETNDELVRAEGARIRHPDEPEQYDARIAAVKLKKEALEKERAVQASKVQETLRSIGLDLQGSAAERCLFPVNIETLIDNAVVARDIAAVVENLGRFLDSEDLATAKRYFGMYLVMIDVRAESFRQYLEKSENGEWRKGVNEILRAAEAAVRSDTANAAQTRFTEAEREIFRKNAATNRKTTEAATAYLDLLRQYEGIIRGKLAEAERVREVAQSSWNTVSLASDLKEIVKTSHEAFEALLSLELPPLVLFDDTALQAEFDAITKKLRKE